MSQDIYLDPEKQLCNIRRQAELFYLEDYVPDSVNYARFDSLHEAAHTGAQNLKFHTLICPWRVRELRARFIEHFLLFRQEMQEVALLKTYIAGSKGTEDAV